LTDRSAVKAACPLEGGGVSEGSTCGVVSGGCMSLALGHLGDLLEEDAKTEDLYRRMREYTAWFEESFGSTLCRDRCGADLRKASGFADYILTGKVLTRCVNHIGKAVEKLIEMVNRPLGEREIEAKGAVAAGGEAPAREGGEVREGASAPAGGYCAAPVLRRIRREVGLGSDLLEKISIALDGGVGLSGGLCGALAGALLALGEVWGIDPKEEGIAGTLRFFVRGHLNLYAGKGSKGLWSVGNPLVRGFRDRFGSLECRELTGRSFSTGRELADHIAGSEACAAMMDWCVERAVEALR